MDSITLDRFKTAQEREYFTALSEIQHGRKITHWMWYIFPQLKGIGHSSTAQYYGIRDLDEARDYMNDDYLKNHLLEISSALLNVDCDDAKMVMGKPDDWKLRSSMTLFSVAAPQEKVFLKVLEKFFDGKRDPRTLKMLGLLKDADDHHRSFDKNSTDRVFQIKDDNIHSLREKHSNGLHFVVGDTHGEVTSLRLLMEKIEFDPQKDHVYFVGDYNAGGNPQMLLQYISQYFQEDYSIPGFHLIRGNHERELFPYYELQNLPDIIVIKSKTMNYYIAHAGMVNGVFDLINEDLKMPSTEQVNAYALHENVACYDAPFRQVIWSRRGLYSQRSHYHVWPSETSLHAAKACIIHGHTPFSQLKHGDYFSYGDKMLFWENQRVWFAEDLQSFDIDSNIKGRFDKNDFYRGLSCVCLEVLDEIAEQNNGILKIEAIRKSKNFVFSVPYTPIDYTPVNGDVSKVLTAKPKMKLIKLNEEGLPLLLDS